MRVFAALYTDEDVANLVATLLKSRGFDVSTTAEAKIQAVWILNNLPMRQLSIAAY